MTAVSTQQEVNEPQQDPVVVKKPMVEVGEGGEVESDESLVKNAEKMCSKAKAKEAGGEAEKLVAGADLDICKGVQTVVDMIKDHPVLGKHFKKANALWSEHVWPKVSPVVDYYSALVSEYPDLVSDIIQYATGLLMVFYGGCITNFFVLYAAGCLSGTWTVFVSWVGFCDAVRTGPGLEKGFGILRSTTPEELNKLFTATCVQICVLKLMCQWMPAFSLAMGISVGNFVLAEFRPVMVAKIKEVKIVPEDLEKWVPNLAKYCVTLVCAIVSFMAPEFMATLLAAFYGTTQLKEKVDGLKGVFGVVLPVLAAVWQMYCEYEVSTLSYVIFSPLVAMSFAQFVLNMLR